MRTKVSIHCSCTFYEERFFTLIHIENFRIICKAIGIYTMMWF